MCEVGGDEREENSICGILKNNLRMIVIFWPSTRPKNTIPR